MNEVMFVTDGELLQFLPISVKTEMNCVTAVCTLR